MPSPSHLRLAMREQLRALLNCGAAHRLKPCRSAGGGPRVDPADQFVRVSCKLPRLGEIGLHDNLSWLRKQSGARLRSTFRDLPRAATSRSGQSRAAREAATLQKARAELADLLMEAKLPITAQTMSCREPEKVMAAALGGMRASTIRKRIREWRKVRAFALGVAGVPWPPHIGLVLDYLQERLDEPCARNVPISILSALGFMEKAGGVALHDRMANQQTLKNMVNQGVMDLEVDAPPTKKAPLMPLMLVGALELLVLDVTAACLCARSGLVQVAESLDGLPLS